MDHRGRPPASMTGMEPSVIASSLLRPSTPSAVMRVTSLLQVAPRVVDFQAFEFHHEYVALMSVRNASDRALRFRLVPPAPASPFKVLYQAQDLATTANPTMMLPPGLSVKYEVVFVPPTPPNETEARSIEHALVHDAIQLQGDDGSRVDVPLVARKAFPELEVDSTLCDVGLVVVGHRAAQVVRVKNIGARPGRFDVDLLDGNESTVAVSPIHRRPSSAGSASAASVSTATDSPVVVTPTRGVLAPGESTTLKVEVIGKFLGPIRGVLRLRVREHDAKEASLSGEDQPEDNESDSMSLGLAPSTYVVDKIVDVTASVVEHNVELLQLHGGEKVQNLFFGSLFAGESRVIETVLRNNGPMPLMFSTALIFGGRPSGGATGSNDEDREAYERRQELQVSPSEGRVEPFGEAPMIFTFLPRSVDHLTLQQMERRLRSGVAKSNDDSSASGTNLTPVTLSAFASIQCADMQSQNITLEISGKAFYPLLEISPQTLDFGDIRSHDRVDMLISVKNISGLPVFFHITKVAHFSTKPSTGRLDVLQSQSIVVSFVPSQLGSFKAQLDVVVNKSVIAFPVHVRGIAAALGDSLRHDLVGGPAALPKDFEPKYKFMLAEDAKNTKGKLTRKFHRMAPYELAALNGTAAIDEYEFQGTNSTHLTYCVKELAKRADHREQYNAFVTELRQRREEKSKKKAMALKQTISVLRTTSNNEDVGEERIEDVAVNLGMDRQGGVEPRMLKLPRELTSKPDPLWLENQSSSSGGKGKKHFFDENKFVKKKFKPQPATQAELADCCMNLTFDQLEQISCGPTTIQFGKLSVNGVSKKSLGVHNGLGQNILVTLHLSDQDHLEELSMKTTLKSQVIPPQTLGGFDLVFTSSREQFFQKVLTISINSVHTRQVTIVAEVAPIVVALSSSGLLFEFSSMDTNPSMTMDLVLANTSDSIAPFQWKALPPPPSQLQLQVLKSRPDSSKSTATSSVSPAGSEKQTHKPIFEIIPSSGTLGPAESLRFQVVYTPPMTAAASTSYAVLPGMSISTAQITLASEFQLDVVGGRKTSLTCRALFAEARFHLKEKRIDFGTIAVGMEKEKRLVILNPANAEEDGFTQRLVFYASVEPANVATTLGLSISPTIGSVLPQDQCELIIKIAPHKPLVLDANATTATLNLQLRGGRCLKIPLLAAVMIPEVIITQPSPIDFGDVIVGISVPRVISLDNRSSITACLIMDLSTSLPSGEFAVALPQKLTKHLEDVSSVFIPMLTGDSAAPSPLALPDSDDSLCTRWQLCIPPNTIVSFHLVFTPRSPNAHDAFLPIQFAGLLNTPTSIARPETITRRVLATALTPRLILSPGAVIQFDKCVITREGIRKVPYTKTLTLTNNDPDGGPISWQIDTSKFKAAALAATQAAASSKRTASAASLPQSTIVFHVAPEKGELAHGEEAKVLVSFLPMDPVEYGEDEIPVLVDDQFYLNLCVSGTGIHPHLSFSENKIVLPTVPLGLPSMARFFIHSTGYDHLELTYRLPLDVSKAPITLQFPKGKILSMACPTIPCEVRFLSKKSVAFVARIEFFDADGNVFHLPISGCTENCLLTNNDFVEAHTHHAEGSDLSSVDTLSYYTDPTYKYPIYLLSVKQVEAENTKYKNLVAKEKAGSEVSTCGAHHSTAGFVDVDGSSFASVGPKLPPSGALYAPHEVHFLVQYLNANFLKTPIVNFPVDVSESLGRPIYELLDMVCTKKPPSNAIVGNNSADKCKAKSITSASFSSSGPSKKELLSQYTAQYAELLKFLKSYGAMLHDVLPEHLLAQDLYVRACEDPRVDPSILSSSALLGMKFLQRRHVLQSEWLNVSTTAWMRVFHQVIKCFLLYRITQKSYQISQANHNQTLAPQASKDTDKSSTSTLISQPNPHRSCQGSNVYSESEMVLVQWICNHVRSILSSSSTSPPSFSPEARLLDLRHDVLDGKLLFHVLASHIPTLSLDSSEYRIFRLSASSSPPTAAQIEQNAPGLLHALKCFGVDFGIDPKTFLVEMNAREIVILLLHMYQMLPQFIPKATIEFKGILGQEMEKMIELKNPSSRLITYHVFLDAGGAEESGFSIDSNHVALEPGKMLAFSVKFKPKFSKKVTARLVFQAVRESNASSGATMVFILASNITARKPVRVIQLDSYTYEKKTIDVVIDNQFPVNGNYKLSMTQSQTQSGHQTVTLGATPPVAGTTLLSTKTKIPPAPTSDKDAAATGTFGQGRRSSHNPNTKSRGLTVENEWSADHAWCLVAQQAFYLPEHGAAAMAASGNLPGGDGGRGAGATVVAIRSQSSATLKLEFLPLVPGNFKCQLLFLDEKVGEFMYEVQATAHLPVTTDTLEFQCELSPSLGGGSSGTGGGRGAGSHFYRELSIPPKNMQLNKALVTFVERANGLLKTKLKEGLKKCEEMHHVSYAVEFNSPYFSPVFHEMTVSHTAPGGIGAGGIKASKQQSLLSGENALLTSRTEVSASSGSGDSGSGKGNERNSGKTLARLGTPRGGGGAGAMLSASPNSVLIDFQPKSAGLYTCKLLLRSHNTVCGSSDWRVYDLVAKVKEPNVKTLLEFVCPARHSIIQEIPLTNPSDTLWTLKALFSSQGSSSGFSGPTSINVPAKKTANYPLTFSPRWISAEKTSLILINPSTQQQFEFELSGYGEEPLAQDHVVLQCQARTSLVHEFDVVSFKTDPPGTQNFKVESDLRDVVGAPMVSVGKPGETAKYPLTFSPLVSGTYFGSVTFTNLKTNEYIWYTVEASVAPPSPEATLDMKTVVRGAMGIEISLENPLDKAVVFSIELQGDGLMGSSTFELDAKQSGVYELVYSPLYATSAPLNGAVLFSNDEIGQFWYALRLVADTAPPTLLDGMICAVGDVCAQPIMLQNPSDRELLLQYRVTNTRNFSIKGSSSASSPGSRASLKSENASGQQVVKISPFGQASAVVEYTPSSLSEFESSRIVFFMPNVVSDWEFEVKGKGRPPSVMKPIRVQSKVLEATSTLFTFKNPFVDALRVDVTLLIDGLDAKVIKSSTPLVFDIILKKPRITLEGFGHLQVPISFLPQNVCEAHAEIVIRGLEDYSELEWRYPIQGVAEAPLHPKSFVLACQARESLERVIHCELLAAPPGFSAEDEALTVEWEIDAARFGALASTTGIERCLHVTPLPHDSDDRLTLPFLVQFAPLRPYRGSVYLALHKKSGGMWRFDVVLDVGDPPVDDVITIESSLNQTSSVSFQLRNQFREPAAFHAEFSAGSSSAFTVYPAEGMLPPFGSDQGLNFVVSFTPTGYGKMQSGQLLVTTEEMQWTFNVKGTYPDMISSLGSKSLSSSASRARLGIDSTTTASPASSFSGKSSKSSRNSGKRS